MNRKKLIFVIDRNPSNGTDAPEEDSPLATAGLEKGYERLLTYVSGAAFRSNELAISPNEDGHVPGPCIRPPFVNTAILLHETIHGLAEVNLQLFCLMRGFDWLGWSSSMEQSWIDLEVRLQGVKDGGNVACLIYELERRIDTESE